MAITAAMVRELREKSGAAMMDCKKALEATGGEMDAAFDHLRKSGLKAAAKKEGRETNEGRVAAHLADDKRSGSIVSVACETDFVANTEDFGTLMSDLTELAASNEISGSSTLLATSHATGATVEEHLKQVIGKLGENIQIADVAQFRTSDGFVGSYVHHNHKIGALAAIKTGSDADATAPVLKQLCQHIVNAKPSYLTREQVPAEEIERERAVFLESEEVQKKPAEFRDKIVDGKLNKFFSERCLVEQGWIFDDKQSVEKAIKSALGGDATVEFFSFQQV
ncbi:MAG: translation elongation factor Ts [Planctomycetota bacterium]|jgi:elongation factor Ts